MGAALLAFSTAEDGVVTGPFIEGVNTITFTVANQGGPTGLRVEMDLSAN